MHEDEIPTLDVSVNPITGSPHIATKSEKTVRSKIASSSTPLLDTGNEKLEINEAPAFIVIGGQVALICPYYGRE